MCSGLATDTSDVDCGFKTYFSSDPLLPKGVPDVHGRSVYYHTKSWRDSTGTAVNKPLVTIQISSEKTKLLDITTALGECTYTLPNSLTVTTPRAIRLFRDPSTTEEDQFAEDQTAIFFVDEWGVGGYKLSGNRFMIAGRCAGSSQYKSPADGRTFKAGSGIPIEISLRDEIGNPITYANDGALNPPIGPHRIAVTIGTNNQVIAAFNTPGESPFFWNQIQPGDYKATLQTGSNNGLPASPNPYSFCVSDAIDPLSTAALDQPLYQQAASSSS